jgi:4-amino-4-deoxy-L-arabinose transferase-like glycosyltransferase
LVIIPLFLWSVSQRATSFLWKSFPWVTGSLLTLVISLPWYLLAEMRTPGFLKYFIVGEHINRFTQSGWQGDKYGFAHAVPYGMVWIYLLGGLLPWLVLVVDYLMNLKHKKFVKVTQLDGWTSYLLFFSMTPLIFFTFSRNIIYTYTFSSIPAFALLLTEGIHRNLFPSLTLKRCSFFASIIGSIFILVSGAFYLNPSLVAKSQNRVIDSWQQHMSRYNKNLIYWASQIDYSAQFYSQGHVRAVRDIVSLTQLLQQEAHPYVVVKANELNEIPVLIRQQWNQIAKIKVLKDVMLLYRSG